jgi:hypothetical protein
LFDECAALHNFSLLTRQGRFIDFQQGDT